MESDACSVFSYPTVPVGAAKAPRLRHARSMMDTSAAIEDFIFSAQFFFLGGEGYLFC